MYHYAMEQVTVVTILNQAHTDTVMTNLELIEGFSIECLKVKTKVATLANQKGH